MCLQVPFKVHLVGNDELLTNEILLDDFLAPVMTFTLAHGNMVSIDISQFISIQHLLSGL